LRQTSLQNSEIDNWLRTLNPKLAVKVVDACHSGVGYVKDRQYLQTLLQKTTNRFEWCYFMFSSTSQQYSYQGNTLSDFTRSFLEGVQSAASDNVRYKDIMDFISDDFESNQLQTPVFVTQATLTEGFTQRTVKLEKALECFLDPFKPEKPKESPVANVAQELTLEETIRKDAVKYRAKEEVNELLLKLKEQFVHPKASDDFTSLYDLEESFEQSLYSLPKKADIGEWLEKHPDEYFASVEKEQEAYKARTFGVYSIGPEYETRYRWVTSGFELHHEGPYNWIKMLAKPKYPNIPWCNCSIVILISKRSIRFFYFFTQFVEKNWSDREQKLNFTWKTNEFPLVEEQQILDFVSALHSQFADWVIEQVRKRFPKTEGAETK